MRGTEPRSTTFAYDNQLRLITTNQPGGVSTTQTYDHDGGGATIRIQAQGGGLEESVIVQAGATGRITGADAVAALKLLQSSLSAADAQARASAFAKVERFIIGASAAGGYMGPGKSFSAGGEIRVDVEVIRPKAPVFLPGGRSDAVIVP